MIKVGFDFFCNCGEGYFLSNQYKPLYEITCYQCGTLMKIYEIQRWNDEKKRNKRKIIKEFVFENCTENKSIMY
jgi:hypothetical protein